MAWDDVKADGTDQLTAAEYNLHVTDQKAHKTRHETGGTDALSALSAAILTSGTIPFARITPNARFKVGAFTRDTATATGTQAITGVGFQPALVIFFANVTGTAKTSFGFDDGSSAQVILDHHNVTADTWDSSAVYSLFIETANNDYAGGAISSFDNDGFTISWTKVNNPTGTASIKYIAFR